MRWYSCDNFGWQPLVTTFWYLLSVLERTWRTQREPDHWRCKGVQTLTVWTLWWILGLLTFGEQHFVTKLSLSHNNAWHIWQNVVCISRESNNELLTGYLRLAWCWTSLVGGCLECLRVNGLQTGSGYLPWTWWVSPKRVYVEPTQRIGMRRLKHEWVDLPRDIEQAMKKVKGGNDLEGVKGQSQGCYQLYSCLVIAMSHHHHPKIDHSNAWW